MENKLPKIDLHAPTDPDYFKRLQASKERSEFFRKHESRNPELWEHRLMEMIGCYTMHVLMQALSIWTINNYLTPSEMSAALKKVGVEEKPVTIGEFFTLFREGYEEQKREKEAEVNLFMKRLVDSEKENSAIREMVDRECTTAGSELATGV